MSDSKPKTSDSHGFTIVETLIVLAIASLILLIILTAIPILQRNSRNNQRRQDVQIMLQAVSRWELNNSGSVPSTAQLRTFLNSYGNLSYYDTGSITVSTPAVTPVVHAIPNPNNLDGVTIRNRAKCDPSGGSATNASAGFSDVVALYAIETGGTGISGQCQQL